MIKQYLKKILKKFNMPGQLSVWPVCLFSVNKPEIGRVKNSHTSSKRCNEARRMSEGGLVMSSCAAANFNNNNTTNANNNNNNNNSNGGGVGRTSSVLPRRKFSFPAVLQSHGLHSELGGGGGGGVDFGGGPSLTVATARRRFSNVSDVVSRKLSHTIGWRTAVPTEQIARQGKALCVQYIRWKLKRAGAYTKKCAGALRAATAAANPVAPVDGNGGGGGGGSSGGYFIPPLQALAAGADHGDNVRREVFPAVLRVGLQLERLDPKLYAAGTVAAETAAACAGASAAAGNPSAAAPPSADSAASAQQRLFQRHRGPPPYRRNAAAASVVLVSVSRELFRAGAQVTWAKVVSLVCVAAGLAVDCARRGRADQLPDLIEAVGEVIEDDLAAWIHYNGGWMGLQSYCKPVVINVENPVSTQILYLVSLLIVVIFFLLLLRWFNFISVFR